MVERDGSSFLFYDKFGREYVFEARTEEEAAEIAYEFGRRRNIYFL